MFIIYCGLLQLTGFDGGRATSGLNPLLFVVVVKVITKKQWIDVVILMAENEESLRQKTVW